jgi:hypothetical protein
VDEPPPDRDTTITSGPPHGEQGRLKPVDIFAVYSPILYPCFTPRLPACILIVCKGCHENIPAPVETLPDDWTIAACPLCGQGRRYLPAEIFQGRLSHQVVERRARGVR